MVCLMLLIAQTILFLIRGGNAISEIPASSIFSKKNTETVDIQGQVYHKELTSNYQILYLKNNSVYDSKLMVYDDTFTDICIGQICLLRGEIKAFEKATNPGSFDQALYYAREGFYGSVWCEDILAIKGTPNQFKESLYQVKCQWKKILMQHLGQINGSVMSAMLLGDKSDMDTYVKELYQKNGIGHILAISGLHISFIGGGIYSLCKKTGMGYKYSGVLSALLLSIYVCVIGWSISVFRAFLMFLIRIGADITGRKYDMVSALLLAAAVTISYEPLYLTDGGFYMSYLAVLGIALIVPFFKKTFPNIKPFLEGCVVSISISILMLPVLLFFYYEIPTYSFVLNMFIIPLMSFLLGFGLAGSLLTMIIPTIGKGCFFLCDVILRFYLWVCEMGIQLPGARLVFGKPGIWNILFYYLVLIFVLAIAKIKKKPPKYIWLFLLIPMLFFLPNQTNQLEVVMVDVGQGDGIFLQGPKGHTYLIDGGSSNVKQVGKYRLEPFLLCKGIRKLDYVFVTHGDADHYNGIEEMLFRQDIGVEISHIVFPSNYMEDNELLKLAVIGKNKGCQILTMNMGQTICEDLLTITCLQPEYTEKLYGNEGSLVLDVSCGSFSMLCTGDVEGMGEERLIKKVRNKKYHILKVAHHGAKASTSAELLTFIKPKVALISSGKDNAYGHPHDETIKRLEEIGCIIYQTAEKGAITIRTDGNSLTISLLPFRL